jgi:head-tail adaptor
MDPQQAARRLRSIQTTFRVAVRLRPREATDDARQQLQRVAFEIRPESDPELERLFDEVRSEIER